MMQSKAYGRMRASFHGFHDHGINAPSGMTVVCACKMTWYAHVRHASMKDRELVYFQAAYSLAEAVPLCLPMSS